MKISLLRILPLLATLVPGLALAEPKPDLDTVKAEFTARFPQIKKESIHDGPVDGMLEIREGTLVAYLTDDGRYLFQGELIDLETDTNLTQKSAGIARKVIMESAPKGAEIVFSPDGETKHSVTIFTDIDCTFCRKLHRQIGEYTSAGIEVRYLLYPRGGPGSLSWSKAEDVLCANDRNVAITMAKNDEVVTSDECVESSLLMDSYRLGAQVGLQGTPAIIFEDGEIVSGYLPPDELARRLGGS
ncbi:MAG: thioredoxin fold domain-containing protein [Pseudomonadota bacterium]